MDVAEELRERTALKYAADCKCGKCQCVPRELVDAAREEILRLRRGRIARWLDKYGPF